MKKLAFMFWLISSPVLAQQPQSNDGYWQRLVAQKEAQSSQQIVDLAKALEQANAKVQELTKELDAEKAKKVEKK